MIVAVMGPPRSGTSLVAGVLQRLGVDMGRRLLNPTAHNPKGYYEDLDFLELHAQLLGVHPPGHPEFTWNRIIEQPITLDQAGRDAYAAACARRSADAPAWGIKDPKLCYLLAEFALACRPDPVHLVAVGRREDAIQASLRAMFPEVPTAKLARAIGANVGSMDQQLAAWHGPAYAVRYEALIADPDRWVDGLARFLGLGPTADAVAFVDPTLNRRGKP